MDQREGRIRVAVVDDNTDLALMLKVLINREADMTCIGTFPDANNLTDLVRQHAPDVVLMDLTMPGREPLEAMAEVVASVSSARFVVLSGHDDPDRIDSAMKSGATAFVAKHGDLPEIIAAIRRAHKAR